MLRLTRLLILLAVSVCSSAYAASRCQTVYDPFLGYRTQCAAGVNFAKFQTFAYQSQYQSQWCWAAAISMLYAYNGFQVDQQRIVNEAYGGIVNLPAQGWQLAQNLNRDWVDNQGRRFRSQLTGLYDVYQGVVGISDAQIVNQLSNGKPLIIGAGGHAMVLTEVSYYLNAYGAFDGYAYAAVFDPWPGRGARYLTAQEFSRADLGLGTMQFLASANVTSLEQSNDLTAVTGGSTPSFADSTTTSGGDDDDDDGGGSVSLFWCLAMLVLLRIRR
ncbi:MAG: hypothetical protein HWE20_14865 [Gammaproteobacteria bacterium]|nr:hypothetical protein [Gammaproteobacteria bacterium]